MTLVYLVLLLGALLAIAGVVSANRFVRQRHLVEESWRQVDVELRRRHDLIPNLVHTVRASAAHETAAIQRVLDARQVALTARAAGDPLPAAEAALSASVGGLLAVAEGYPQLTAAPGFQQLQSQLAETEDRLAAARRLHNGNVRALNTRVESFPSSLVASAMSVEQADYLELGPAERDRLELTPDLSADELAPLPVDPPRP
jgi:LemA protein